MVITKEDLEKAGWRPPTNLEGSVEFLNERYNKKAERFEAEASEKARQLDEAASPDREKRGETDRAAQSDETQPKNDRLPMTDENANTADLTMDEKLDRILSRLSRLESQEEEGTDSTRPLLDQIIKETVTTREMLSEQITTVGKELRSINRRLDIFAADISKLRGDIQGLDERVSDLERRPN